MRAQIPNLKKYLNSRKYGKKLEGYDAALSAEQEKIIRSIVALYIKKGVGLAVFDLDDTITGFHTHAFPHLDTVDLKELFSDKDMVKALLAELKASGIKIALVTLQTHTKVDEVLTRGGMDRDFDYIYARSPLNGRIKLSLTDPSVFKGKYGDTSDSANFTEEFKARRTYDTAGDKDGALEEIIAENRVDGKPDIIVAMVSDKDEQTLSSLEVNRNGVTFGIDMFRYDALKVKVEQPQQVKFTAGVAEINTVADYIQFIHFWSMQEPQVAQGVAESQGFKEDLDRNPAGQVRLVFIAKCKSMMENFDAIGVKYFDRHGISIGDAITLDSLPLPPMEAPRSGKPEYSLAAANSDELKGKKGLNKGNMLKLAADVFQVIAHDGNLSKEDVGVFEQTLNVRVKRVDNQPLFEAAKARAEAQVVVRVGGGEYQNNDEAIREAQAAEAQAAYLRQRDKVYKDAPLARAAAAAPTPISNLITRLRYASTAGVLKFDDAVTQTRQGLPKIQIEGEGGIACGKINITRAGVAADEDLIVTAISFPREEGAGLLTIYYHTQQYPQPRTCEVSLDDLRVSPDAKAKEIFIFNALSSAIDQIRTQGYNPQAQAGARAEPQVGPKVAVEAAAAPKAPPLPAVAAPAAAAQAQQVNAISIFVDKLKENDKLTLNETLDAEEDLCSIKIAEGIKVRFNNKDILVSEVSFIEAQGRVVNAVYIYYKESTDGKVKKINVSLQDLTSGTEEKSGIFNALSSAVSAPIYKQVVKPKKSEGAAAVSDAPSQVSPPQGRPPMARPSQADAPSAVAQADSSSAAATTYAVPNKKRSSSSGAPLNSASAVTPQGSMPDPTVEQGRDGDPTYATAAEAGVKRGGSIYATVGDDDIMPLDPVYAVAAAPEVPDLSDLKASLDDNMVALGATHPREGIFIKTEKPNKFVFDRNGNLSVDLVGQGRLGEDKKVNLSTIVANNREIDASVVKISKISFKKDRRGEYLEIKIANIRGLEVVEYRPNDQTDRGIEIGKLVKAIFDQVPEVVKSSASASAAGSVFDRGSPRMASVKRENPLFGDDVYDTSPIAPVDTAFTRKKYLPGSPAAAATIDSDPDGSESDEWSVDSLEAEGYGFGAAYKEGSIAAESEGAGSLEDYGFKGGYGFNLEPVGNNDISVVTASMLISCHALTGIGVTVRDGQNVMPTYDPRNSATHELGAGLTKYKVSCYKSLEGQDLYRIEVIEGSVPKYYYTLSMSGEGDIVKFTPRRGDLPKVETLKAMTNELRPVVEFLERSAGVGLGGSSLTDAPPAPAVSAVGGSAAGSRARPLAPAAAGGRTMGGSPVTITLPDASDTRL